jgi:flagellar biosynthetic protein FliS
VLLLYGAALAALRRARRRLGDPRADLGRALSILTELAASLAEREDREAVLNLASLYHYMIHRLMDAVECGDPAPMVEVERLLQTLWEGWIQVIQSDVGGGFPDSLEEHDRPAASPPSLLSAS